MKIKQLLRCEYFESEFLPKLNLQERKLLKSWPGVRGINIEGRRLEAGRVFMLKEFSGVSFRDSRQVYDFLKGLIPEGFCLSEFPQFVDSMGPPKEGETIELPEVRLFDEVCETNGRIVDKPVSWAVVFDLDGPKKVQVSLTLSSALLKRLRREAEESGQSLSGLIDERLSRSMTDYSEEVANVFKFTLNDINESLEAARAKYDDIYRVWRRSNED